MKSVVTFILLALVTMFAGCSTREKPVAQQENKAPLVWPAPPAAPRIAFVQKISEPGDLGIKRSTLGRFARWVTGANKEKEGLQKPFGLALDENGNLCITDTGANAVFYFDRLNKKWKRFDRIGKTRFASPVAVAKRNGIFYVADSGLGAVLAFKDDGKMQFQIKGKLERPTGLAIFQDRLFVVDSQRHCIAEFDLNGRAISEFGTRGVADGEFNFPTHIAVGEDGKLYVTDSMNSRVQMLDRTGKFVAQIGGMGDSTGQFSRPKGVALDTLGHVYVVDALFDNVQIFDRSGKFLLNLGEAGANAGQFWLPNGIVISPENEIFVADSYNGRVQVLKYVGAP